ncbi:MAG: DUF3809 domain-containing protein [Deinococcus-Thermus bacterium]|nr:DUF3809 domain-containing protein [Deinococcota bacterium]
MGRGEGALIVRLTRQVAFDVPSSLDRGTAVAFVRDAARSLSHADFLSELRHDEDGLVSAELPVNAALFGQQRLRFHSRLDTTPTGARLDGLALDDAPGWARVSGEARVVPLPNGSRLDYRFDIEIHLALPEPERWGGRALVKMIEVTADRVLQRVCERFPAAVRAAARAYEAKVAA